MAGKSVNFAASCDQSHRKQNNSNDAMIERATREIAIALNICDSQLESIAKWLSCNGDVWGMGPTAVFASAAALFLYNELEASIFIPGDQAPVSNMEKTLISTMMLGMLALMIHLWVCSMRFFQYYFDTIIRDSPSVLLEMTTVGLLGAQSEYVPLGPLTRFLRQQQPQIHITVCWFLSLCYADYVRKHYCTRFNLPYLEQWQGEMHARVMEAAQQAMTRVNSFVESLHQRLRGYEPIDSPTRLDSNTSRAPNNAVNARYLKGLTSTRLLTSQNQHSQADPPVLPAVLARTRRRRSMFDSSGDPATPRQSPSKNSETVSRQRILLSVAHKPRSLVLGLGPPKSTNQEKIPWRRINRLPFDILEDIIT